MSMKKNKLRQFSLDLYSETLDNGLLINVIPKTNVNNIYVTFSTKYGSVHDEFIPIDQNDFYKVPMGVAHFLEHKVFEQEDGKDPFTRFSTNGADANANTSNYKTTYLFSGPSNLSDNLNFLLDFVQSPYFTDENVEKEKGIIAQELKMLNDKPYWHLYEKALLNSFINHPIKYPVGGTLETIKRITKDDLYTCYNTFYHPANMFITISGNVEPEEVIDIIKNNQDKKTFKSFKNITLKDVEYAVLENSGKLNIFKYSFLGLDSANPFPLILDGVVQKDTLCYIDKDEKWLHDYLRSNDLKKEDVFYAFYKNNKIYVIKRNELIR